MGFACFLMETNLLEFFALYFSHDMTMANRMNFLALGPKILRYNGGRQVIIVRFAKGYN